MLELYALDLLDGAERADVERLLAADEHAREQVRHLRSVAAALALEIEPMEASPGLKARILDAARADLDVERAFGDAKPPPAPVSIASARARRRSARDWAGWSVAAVLAVALIGSLVWNAQLRNDRDNPPPAVAYGVTTSGNAVGASGAVVVVGERALAQSALLTLSNLPALERGKVYQVWLIAGAPEPNVTFTPDKTGYAEVAVPGQIADYTTLAVTIEPSGGSAAPTTEPVIVSTISEQQS